MIPKSGRHFTDVCVEYDTAPFKQNQRKKKGKRVMRDTRGKNIFSAMNIQGSASSSFR
jgi:hypothetical protein